MSEPKRIQQVPSIDNEAIARLCQRLYGIRPITVLKLNSYDDRNYFVAELTHGGSLTNADGYVLKVTNTLESSTPDLIEGQNALLKHLKDHDLPVPSVISALSGKNVVRTFVNYDDNENELKGGEHAVRLFRFIPGDLLGKVVCTADIYYKVGKTLAQMHIGLEDFHHNFFDNHRGSPWSLNNANMVAELAPIVEDRVKRNVVMEVIDNFRQKVLIHLDLFDKGQIHGDFNEQNILLSSPDINGRRDVCGILDFGDSHRGCLMFDVAICIVYMMLECATMTLREVGGHVLAGYLSQRAMPIKELRLIRLCMCARYCQSLVYGLHAFAQNPTPNNRYVLTTQTKGWPQLLELWRVTDDELYGEWSRVLSAYGINIVIV